jgi:phosphoserine / homoserine phosphotransferase
MQAAICTLDLEGVLVPEIWINVADKTGIEALRLTTRDISDYDELMTHRLKVLDEHTITLSQIQEVIAGLSPLDGAKDFLDWLKSQWSVIILSDTFYQFAQPLMKQLDFPTLFCHSLAIKDDRIINYQLRMPDQKRASVEALQSLNFKVMAAGDSYNDVSMLTAANNGILFKAPQNVISEFPEFPVTTDYDELKKEFLKASAIE